MLDKFFEIGVNLDWISPAWSMINDALRGSRADFTIGWDCGWSANQVGDLLTQHGVNYWGLMVRGGAILFSVKEDDSDDTIDILQQNGLME